jgi:hypothetical protein
MTKKECKYCLCWAKSKDFSEHWGICSNPDVINKIGCMSRNQLIGGHGENIKTHEGFGCKHFIINPSSDINTITKET